MVVCALLSVDARSALLCSPLFLPATIDSIPSLSGYASIQIGFSSNGYANRQVPPSILTNDPVIKLLASDARNRIPAAISCGFPGRPSIAWVSKPAQSSLGVRSNIGVSTAAKGVSLGDHGWENCGRTTWSDRVHSDSCCSKLGGCRESEAANGELARCVDASQRKACDLVQLRGS